MTRFETINLHDLIEELGADHAQGVLDSYACPLNHDIERFARERAVEFSRQGIAQTHLVFRGDSEAPAFVGYFALANKVLVVREGDLSKTLFKQLSRFGLRDDQGGSLHIAMPLIAQIGKNYADGRDAHISGDELLGIACAKVNEIQQELGGKMTYLECEDVPALVEFYTRNGFRLIRPSGGAGELMQLIRRS